MPYTHGFIGPGSQTPGTGGGSFKLDAGGNVGFGVSSATPSSTFDDNGQGFGNVFMVASSTNPGLALKNLFSGNTYLWSSRNFGNLHLYRESATLPGKVIMDITPTGNVGISVFGPTERLEVGGNVKGNAFVGSVSGAITAGNVSSDVFGSLQGGGAFAFPGSLGVATSTKTGLPQPLSVYGNAYVSGNVGIGTADPTALLHLAAGDIRLTQPSSTGTRLINAGTTFIDFGNTSNQQLRFGAFGGMVFDIDNNNNETGSYFRFTHNNGVDLLYIQDSGNVGIGTTGPVARLHVNNAGTGSGDHAYAYFTTGDTGATSGDGLTIGYAANDTAQINNRENTRLEINSSGGILMQTVSGNVSIGTTASPATARLVVATSTTGATIDVSGGKIINLGTPTAATDATTKSYVDSIVGGSGGVGSGTSGQTLRHDGSGWVASSLIYNNGTNVGIGITLPSMTLDVNGNILARGANILFSDASTSNREYISSFDGGITGLNTTGVFGFFADTSLGGTATAPTAGISAAGIYSSGNVGIGSTSPATNLDVVGGGAFTQPVSVGTPTGSSHAATKSYVDSTIAGSGGGAWTLSGSNAYFSLAGNVGIGTASPGQKLHVNTNQVLVTGTTAPALRINTDATDATDADRAFFGIATGASNFVTGSVANDTVLRGRSTGSGSLIFGLGTTERMRIASGGNVGIGSTSPATKLDVAGSIQALNYKTVSTNTDWSQFIRNGSGAVVYINQVDTTNPILRLSSGTASPNSNIVFTVENNGSVGIGSTSPGYKLDVTGTGQFSQPVIVGTPTATNHATTKSYVDSMFTGSGQWTTSGSNIYSSLAGNVGIGTTNPGQKLVVQGDAGMRIIRNSNSDQTLTLTGGDGSGNAGIVAAYSLVFNANKDAGLGGNINFQSAGSSKMYIKSDGNVGIGTTNPNSTLQVNGSFGADNGYKIVKLQRGDGATNNVRWYLLATLPTDNYRTLNFKIVSSNNFTTSPPYGIDTIHFQINTWLTGTPVISYWIERNSSSIANPARIVVTDEGDGNIRIYNTTGRYGDATLIVETYTGIGGSWYSLNPVEFAQGTSVPSSIAASVIYDTATAPPDHIISVGSLGIGTVPQYGLHVVGTGSFSQPVIVGTPTATNHATTKSYVDSMFTGSGQWTTSGSNIYFALSGNVGIGTTSPSTRLDVSTAGVSGILLNTDTGATANSARLFFKNASSTFAIMNAGDTMSFRYGATVNSSSGTEAGRLQNNGNWYFANSIGIGTTSPGGRLNIDLGATDGNIGFTISENGNNRFALVGYYAGAGGTGNYTTLRADSTDIMTWQLGGNVGIGTTSPTDKLDIFSSSNDQRLIRISHPTAPTQASGFLGFNSDGTTSNNVVTLGVQYSSTYYNVLNIQRSTRNVGINNVSPSYAFDVSGTAQFTQPVIVGTPTNNSHAATKSYVDSILQGSGGSFASISVTGTSTLSGNWQLGGAALGNVNLNGYDIVGVNKITAAVIDPLYEIDGEKYATYAPSVAGGVREEYVGRARLTRSIKYQVESIKYEYVIDLAKSVKGSDLWVWYNAVDFSKDNVEAVATPYGSLAQIGYRIEGEKIIFFGDAPSEFSFRLFGKRHDWKEWTTERSGVTEEASFKMKSK